LNAVIRVYDEAGDGLDEADLYWGRVTTQYLQWQYHVRIGMSPKVASDNPSRHGV
jgi:hypothetical protein